MQPYAQTHIQLLTQLSRDGYSDADLDCIVSAYKMVMCLFTGLYRPSGKTFIAHLVGTASILGSLHVPAKVVAAGLIHAAYTHGDFGAWAKGISEPKRKQVRQALGKEVEEYIARYIDLKWNGEIIPAIYDELDTLGPIDRDVLLMRLANELDDLLDLGVLYCFNAEDRRRSYLRCCPMIMDMAEKLGFPSLAAELEAAIQETKSAEVIPELRSRSGQVRLVAPKSYRRRLRVELCQKLARGIH